MTTPMADVVEMLDRFERAAMAYERLGKLTRDDEKTRQIRKDTIAELAAARSDLRARLSQAGAGGGAVEALRDLCDAWDDNNGGGKYRGNVTNAQRAARAVLSALAPSPKDIHEIIAALEAGVPFVFDPATHFCHADDGGAPEHGIKWAPVDATPPATPVQPTASVEAVAFDPRDGFEAWAEADNRDMAAREFEDRNPENFMFYAADSTNHAYVGWYFATKRFGSVGRAEDDAESFIQAAIDRAPEPLRRLGEWLAGVLDEDDWKTAERMLLGASLTPAPTQGDGTEPGDGMAEMAEIARIVSEWRHGPMLSPDALRKIASLAKPASEPAGGGVREALKAIAEGYAIAVHDDRYITVDNPRYQPDNGSAPKLVIDTAALSSPATPEPVDQTGIAESIRALAAGDPAHMILLTEDEAKAAIANAKAWLAAQGATPEPVSAPAGEVVDSFAAGVEAAARFVEQHELLHASNGDEVRRRTEGNRAGLGYVAGIRALSNPAPGHGEGGL